MSSEKIIDSLFDNNLEQFRNQVRSALYAKAGEYMQNAKQELAGAVMGGEDVQEELIGKQKQLDVAAPFGKLTGADFKKLGNNKKIKEAYAYPEGEVEDDCFQNCHKQNVHGKGGNEYHNAFQDCVKRCKKKG
jgi:hypothetical protein